MNPAVLLATTNVLFFPLAARIIMQSLLGAKNTGFLAHFGYLAITLVCWVVSGWVLYLWCGLATSIWRTVDDWRYTRRRISI